ncbi:MAG: FtsX-like permease family protein [Luteitalea sp.]|nr:FtsX-like permease family protein [Luteitalea sp.]
MLSDLALRLRSVFKRRAVEQELDDELQFHLERQVTSYMRQGLARDDAVRRARLELGGLDQIKEEHRDARGISLVDDLDRDVRYAARQVCRSPGFALLAVLCLGLGSGVNIAIFSLVNAVLLRPMPVADPERLTLVSRGERTGWSYAAYLDFQARSRTLSGLTASFPMESDLDVDGESEFVAAEVVSANYADVLGVRPSLGRWFVDDREPVAVISHAVWERRFNLSPDVLGRRIRSASQSYTVVGVAPREFAGVFAPLRTDIWKPIRTHPGVAARLEDREAQPFMLFGRLRAGTTAPQASAELNAVDAQLMVEHGRPPEIQSPIVAEHVRGIPNPRNRREPRIIATLLASVAALVLLIACVNVGNLLLVRGALRQREFAMRRALGASRFRLLRQLLTESLVLAIGGGICGVVLAVWTSKLLETSAPAVGGAFAVQLDLSLDWRAILFATMISLAATVLCGLLPAWRTSQARGLVAFKGEIGGGTPRRRPLGLVAQVVMSLVLLFVAGSFLQALLRLQATDPGFEVARRLYAYTFIPSPPFTPESGREFYSQALERVRALPGVRTAALTSFLPLMPIGSPGCASLPGGPQIPTTASTVGIGLFETMGIDIVAGRDFAAADLSTDTETVVMNESLARRIWPNGPVVGERVMNGCDDAQATVVGVVRDSAIRELGEPPQPHLYRPFAQHSGGVTAILLETSTDPAGMVQPVRRTLLGLGKGIRVYAVQPLGTHVEQSYAERRWVTTGLTGIGLLALLLAAIGLYGVIAYRVTLRTQEIGIRMALGATRRAIFREVVSHGLAIVLVGVAIGEVMTAALTGVVGSMLEGIGPTGLSTHVAIGLIWIAVAFVACYLPAARAARVDPLVALRYE